MKTIVGGRQSGKTTEIIKTAHDTGAAILCSTETEAKFIKYMAKELRVNENNLNILTVQDIVSGKIRGQQFNGIVIDNGDLVLQSLLEKFLHFGFAVQYVTPSRQIPSRITDRSDFD